MTIGATRQAHEILREWASELPEHLSRKASSSTYEGASAIENYIPTFSKFPLFRLSVSGQSFVTSKAIGVRVAQDGDWYFAENEALKVIGTGESVEEAVSDLEQHIVHFWNYYRNLDESQVTGEAVKLRNLFSGLLAEEFAQAA